MTIIAHRRWLIGLAALGLAGRLVARDQRPLLLTRIDSVVGAELARR